MKGDDYTVRNGTSRLTWKERTLIDMSVGRNLNKIAAELVDEDEVLRDNEPVHTPWTVFAE